MTAPGHVSGVAGAGLRLLRVAGHWARVTRAFYAHAVAWLGLIVSAAALTFGGGAVMFWFHAIVRGEDGPAIHYVHHWLLDSTLGFVALTPVLAMILPLSVRHATVVGGPGPQARLGAYVAVTAITFTAFTGPGPLLHNAVAGAGTPLADLATSVFGEVPDAHAGGAHGQSRSPVVEGMLQLGVGLPVYTACTWLALALVRRTVGASRRRPHRAPARLEAAVSESAS